MHVEYGARFQGGPPGQLSPGLDLKDNLVLAFWQSPVSGDRAGPTAFISSCLLNFL